MSALIDYALPAMLVSIAALGALRWASEAPAHIRFGIACAGLLAWFIPWPMLSLTFTTDGISPVLPWLGDTAGQWTTLKLEFAQSLETASVPVAGFGYWSMLIFAPGIAWLAVELLQHRATVVSWQRGSVRRNELLAHLPHELQGITAELRIVAESSAAAATGLRRQQIFIGDALLRERSVTVALVHEAMHLHRRDPVRVLLITTMARLFWFNPLARSLRTQAMLAIESGCDEACVSILGREYYRGSLARQMLDRQCEPTLTLAPALHKGGLNLARLRLLGRTPETGARVWGAIAALFAAGLTGAAFASSVAADLRIGNWMEITDASRYGYDISPVSRRYEALGGGMVRLSGNLSGSGGASQRAELRCDGHDYPVQGTPGAEIDLVVSCEKIDWRTTRYVTSLVDDASSTIRSVRTETVAPDGNSLSVSDSFVLGDQTIESWRQFSRSD